MKNVTYLLVSALILVMLSIGVWLSIASGNVVVDKKLIPSGNENSDVLSLQKEFSSKQGFAKFTALLPDTEVKEGWKVRFIIGKNAKVDRCNKSSFVGKIIEKSDVENERYLELELEPGMRSTTIACGPMDLEKFVLVEGEGLVRSYPDQKKLVLYVPEDFEVTYVIEKK